MSLTKKRIAFVEEYLRCWNASEAARRAGYRGKANVIGSRLLANVDIQTLIQARLTDLAMSADEVLVRLAAMARADSRDRLRALELIGKHHRLFVDVQETKLEHSLSDDTLATIDNALGRAYGHGDPDPKAD